MSRREIKEACSAELCEEVTSWCWDCKVLRVRASFLRLVSDSRRRRSRACCSVDSDSATRETACRSGVMLKFWVVWAISCRRGLVVSRMEKKKEGGVGKGDGKRGR